MRVDGRTLSHDALETIRRMAVRRVWEGEEPSAVISSYGMSRTSIYRWLAAASRGGWDALGARRHPGPREKLAPEQQRLVHDWISGHDPRAYGYSSGLWTRRIVGSLILDRLGVELCETTVGNLLRRIGITRQKPLRRAYERDPEAIRRWVENTYPALRKEATKRGADIFFLDESGVRSDGAVGRTWSPRGQRPIVLSPGRRQSVNAISAVTAHGTFWYAVYHGALNARKFIGFLRQFLRSRRRPVFLIVDGHPAHRAKEVASFVQSLSGRLAIYFLPGYAPDLNPDEFVWNHMKTQGLRRQPLREGESLDERVKADLRSLSRRPDLVRSFFGTHNVA